MTDFFHNLVASFGPEFNIFSVLDILVVATIFYYIYKAVKATKAMRILSGLAVLAVIMLVGQAFNLVLLNWIMGNVLIMLAVAIPVVFQPELRRALERMGRFKYFSLAPVNKYKQSIEEVVRAVEAMSKNKIGALIVFERSSGLQEYVSSGHLMDAKISSELILNIFQPNTPLHDGAVIIGGGRIVAAGCRLPLSDAELNWVYGTRHRAAFGVSETSDAVVLVVSEERGVVSLVSGGAMLEDLTGESLADELYKLLLPAKKKKKKAA